MAVTMVGDRADMTGFGRRSMRGLAVIATVVMQLHGLPVAEAAPPSQTPEQMEADCWQQFMESRSPEISCGFPAVMEKADREQVQKITRQLLKDAQCQITIKLERALLDAAVEAPDNTFIAPPQPVACEIDTSRGKLPVAFTFAPKIEIKGGKAIKATPGMANVTGVNSWLAWPVTAYINASGSIQDVMLRVVNAYLERKRPPAATP